MKQNLRELDFFRAFTAFLVIAIHIVSGRINSSKFIYAWDVLMSCAVPMFVMLSGYLLYLSNHNRESVSYFEFLKKRLSRILVPYLVWTVIYMLSSLEGKYSEIMTLGFVRQFAGNIITGKGFVHLYFMIIILQLYFLYPVLAKVMQKNAKLCFTASFLISFYFHIEPYLRQYGVNILPAAGRPYYFTSFGRWIFYFVLGMYLFKHAERLLVLASTCKAELAVFWILAGTSLVTLSRTVGMANPVLNPLTILYNLSSFLLLYAVCLLCKGIDSKVGGFLQWFSKQSFIIYLSHLLLIKLILLKISTVFGIYVWKGGFGLILLLFSSVVITCIFAFIISLTPLAPILGGVAMVKSAGRSQSLKVTE
jgi:surface polysaccharide O-acyltransferase-like enzyme